MKVVTVQVTPPAAAAAVVVTVALNQKATASSRARRERRARKKIPIGITAPRPSSKSRVRRPPLAGAGHRSGLKRSPEITGEQGQRGDGAGVSAAAWRTSSNWREVKTEGVTTAGTESVQVAPKVPGTEVGAESEERRTGVKSGVTVEIERRAEVAQTEGRVE